MSKETPMRHILCAQFHLLLVLGLTVLPSSEQALADEPPGLPTDGIDEPAPGPLALPDRFDGPGGIEVSRSVNVSIDNRSARDGLTIIASYGQPLPDGDVGPPESVLWDVKIHMFERKGAAHAALHACLAPAASGPIAPWSERWQRVVEAPGILLGQVYPTGCGYLGVFRQSYVQISGTVHKSVAHEERAAVVERAVTTGRDLALRALRMVEEAEPALRPMRATFAEQVVVDHKFLLPDGRSRILVRMTPGFQFGSGRARLEVFAGSRGRRAYATADELEGKPLAVIEFPRETDSGLKSPADADPTGLAVRVFRVIEGEVLAIEELRMTAGARGSQVVKTP
jgi:hypothetical protein